MNEEKIQLLFFKKLNKDSIIPSKGSEHAAGYDLFSYENVEIPSMEKAMIHTGISVQLPKNSYGRIAPRSGLTWKKFIDVGAGVIDEDYRGESDRIAQLIIEKIVPTKVVPVEEYEELNDTKRGNSGFGSTGMNSFT